MAFGTKTVEAEAKIIARDMTGAAFASASKHAQKYHMDMKRFQKSMGRDTVRSFGAAETAALSFGKSLALGIGISATSAVYKLGTAVGDTMDRLDGLDELSSQIGMSAQNISFLQHIAKKEGIAAEQVDAGLKKVGQAYFTLQKNLRGSKQLQQAFPGLSAQIKGAKSVEEAVSIALTAMDKMKPEAALKWAKLMFGDEDFAKLKKNMATWRREKAEMERLGGIITPQMTKDAAAYNDAMDDLGLAMQSVINPMTAELAKNMTPLLHDMGEWVALHRTEIGDNIKAFFTGITDTIRTTKKELGVLIRGLQWLQGLYPERGAWVKALPDMPQKTPHGGGGRYDTGKSGSIEPAPSGVLEALPDMPQKTPHGGGGRYDTGKQSMTAPPEMTGKGGTFAAGDLSPEARSFLAGVSSVESGKGADQYHRINYTHGQNKYFKGNRHPFEGQKGTTASGKYQFLWTTWEKTAKKMGIDPHDFSPANQDRAAWFLAKEDYKIKSGGRSLEADMKNPKNRRYIAKILGTDQRRGKAQWVGLGDSTSKAVGAMNRQSELDAAQAGGTSGNGKSASLGKGEVSLKINIAGQPAKVDQIRVKQADNMTISAGVDNTGARYYRPGSPTMGPV